MRHIALIYIAILMMTIAGCSQTDMPTSDFTLSANIQGNWQVETMNANNDWTTLGTLTVDGTSYHFDAVPSAEISSWAQDQLCFFEQPVGEVAFEYETDVSPDNDIRTFENDDILLKVRVSCGKIFLIRVNQNGKELYWHSVVSEIQFYSIRKSYGY